MIFWQGFLEAAEKFGVAVAVSLGMAWGLTQGTIWIGENVIKPTVETHLDLVRDISKESQEQTKVLIAIKTQQEQHTKILSEILKRTEGDRWR